jgi:hypothetical protein
MHKKKVWQTCRSVLSATIPRHLEHKARYKDCNATSEVLIGKTIIIAYSFLGCDTVMWHIITNVLEKPAASVLRVKN